MPDKVYLKKKYKLITGKELNLENPQTFNEKLQWLKLYDHRPEYMMMEVDSKMYFSALTFFPCSGFMPFKPEEYDLILQNWIKLPIRGGVENS